MYQITPAILDAAKKLGVVVKPSLKPNKKICVFTNDGKFIRSIGATGYGDFHIFLRRFGLDYAKAKRKLYWSRHAGDANIKLAKDGRLSAGFLAARILWPR
jgi:hypothetical protein